MLAGLEHAHGAGVVHRDVTPANLLLDATGANRPHLWLADFGLAVRTGEPRLTRLGTVVGTPGYLPPEVLAGARPAPSADLFAAGQVGVALLRGIEPDGAAEPPPGLGSPLGEVVAALVAADPADRPASAAQARRALAPVRAGPAAADRGGRANHHPAAAARPAARVDRGRSRRPARRCPPPPGRPTPVARDPRPGSGGGSSDWDGRAGRGGRADDRSRSGSAVPGAT